VVDFKIVDSFFQKYYVPQKQKISQIPLRGQAVSHRKKISPRSRSAGKLFVTAEWGAQTENTKEEKEKFWTQLEDAIRAMEKRTPEQIAQENLWRKNLSTEQAGGRHPSVVNVEKFGDVNLGKVGSGKEGWERKSITTSGVGHVGHHLLQRIFDDEGNAPQHGDEVLEKWLRVGLRVRHPDEGAGYILGWMDSEGNRHGDTGGMLTGRSEEELLDILKFCYAARNADWEELRGNVITY
jgi:hypothetical protein